MKKITVLLIEGFSPSAKIITECLNEEGIIVFSAQTIPEARALIEKELVNSDLVIMGACLESKRPDTPPLVEYIIAKGFTKPVIANPIIHGDSKILRQAGATHENGGDVVELVLQLLGKA